MIALIFTFWVLSFFVDLLPATRSKQEKVNAMIMGERMGMTMENEYAGGADVGHPPANGNTDGAVNGNPHAHTPVGVAENF